MADASMVGIAAYLIAAHQATRPEIDAVMRSIMSKRIPDSTTASLDLLDTEIMAVRASHLNRLHPNTAKD